jgi:two-component system response regulator FixJ
MLFKADPAPDSWISVIDPDAAYRDALLISLAGLGAEVRTYQAAEPFLAGLHDTLPVCLISEVNLPAMSGLMLLRYLKSVGKSVPAILLATDPEVSLAVEAIREGALDFIEKPFLNERVARRVAALLAP